MGSAMKKTLLPGIMVCADFISVPPNISTLVPVDYVVFNKGDMFDPADPGYVQIKKDGLYFCACNGYWSGAGGVMRYVTFFSDNLAMYYDNAHINMAGSAPLEFMSGAWVQEFEVGDRLYWEVRHNAPSNIIYRSREPSGISEPYGFVVQMLDER